MNDINATHDDILPWLEPLVHSALVWQEVGSAGGVRAISALIGHDDHVIEYLNLVTACAAAYGKAFHSGEYHMAAATIGMPSTIASALIRAGDNNLPESNEYFGVLAKLINFLANGGNLLKDSQIQ